MLQQRNLFDPIVYIVNQLMNRRLGTGASGEKWEKKWKEKEVCWDQNVPVDLIRENGLLKKVVYTPLLDPDTNQPESGGFTIELFYGPNKVLDRVIGTCDDGYKLEVKLIFTNGILTRVEPTETKPQLEETELEPGSDGNDPEVADETYGDQVEEPLTGNVGTGTGTLHDPFVL